MSKSNVLKASVGYTVGNILIKGISFLTLPLFTHYLTPSDFGIYTTYVSYESILTILVGLGLYMSIRAANIEFKGKIDQYVSFVNLLPYLFAILLVLFSAPFVQEITFFFGFENYNYIIFLLIAQSLGSSVIMMYNSRISLDYSYKKYIILSLVSTLSNIGVSLVLILFFLKEAPFLGRILGTSLPIFVIGIVLSISFIKKAKPKVNKEYLHFALSYSLPLVPHGLSQIVLAQFGKIVIQKVIGNFAAGIYGFVYTIAFIPQILVSSLDSAWGPWFFEKYDRKEINVLKDKTDVYIISFALITIILMSCGPEIVSIMGSSEYYDARKIVCPALLGVFFVFLYGVPAQVEYFYKKTRYLAIGTLIAAVINILACIYFIPRYGYQAAVYITVITYILYFIAHLLIAYHITDKNLPFNVLHMFTFATIVTLICVVMQFCIQYWYIRYLIMIISLLYAYIKYRGTALSLIKQFIKRN